MISNDKLLNKEFLRFMNIIFAINYFGISVLNKNLFCYLRKFRI